MITDDEAESDLRRLVSTDDEAGEKKVDVERKAYALKRTKAILFMGYESGSIELKNSMAIADGLYEEAEKLYLETFLKSEKINNMRKTLSLKLDVYRTQCANRRQG